MFWLTLIISAVISFFAPMVLGQVISNMTITQDFPLAWKFAMGYFGLQFLSIMVGLVRVPFFKKLENYVKRDVKLDVIRNSFNINIGEYENLGNGLFVTRLTTDLNSLANSFKSLSETIVSFASKIGFIIYVTVINYWIGLYLILFIIIRYSIYQIRIHYYAKLKPKVLKKGEEINSLIGESVRGIKDIKTLGLGTSVLDHVNSLQTEYANRDNNE